MADRPTIFLSNWSSYRAPGCHGPGRKLTIMARPRPWEHGVGKVPACTPTTEALDSVKDGRRLVADYRAGVEAGIRGAPHAPGGLTAIIGGKAEPVADGDTLCCGCSRERAAAGLCHRAWVAPILAAAGWRVVLDGKEVPP